MDILFEGDKIFWQEKCTLNITIALNSGTSCIEVVCFEVATSIEYPPVYLDFIACKAKVNSKEFNDLLVQKNESLASALKEKKINIETLEKEARYELITAFILRNFDVKAHVGSVGSFEVFLFDQSIESNPTGGLFCKRPYNWVPVHVKRGLTRT